jgi:phosphate starvation-inducible protein PhoH and related proteins
LKERFESVSIVTRNGVVKLVGDEPDLSSARDVVEQLLGRFRSDGELTYDAVAAMVGIAPKGAADAPTKITGHIEGYRARTAGQQKYLDLLEKNEIVFAIGPAGTGKSFLAVLKACQMLKSGDVKKIVLCRPAVEAGERLGFLPGDFQAKVNPYLRPLYDALNEILDIETVRKLLERETIEIVPLAYMRGRTLNQAFIILDEAQNTTREQMKMFLTRMGEGSRIVVTGDITQIDLLDPKKSGLVHIQRIMKPVEGIAFHHLTGQDIVRHKHVIQSYDRADKDEAAHAPRPPS